MSMTRGARSACERAQRSSQQRAWPHSPAAEVVQSIPGDSQPAIGRPLRRPWTRSRTRISPSSSSTSPTRFRRSRPRAGFTSCRKSRARSRSTFLDPVARVAAVHLARHDDHKGRLAGQVPSRNCQARAPGRQAGSERAERQSLDASTRPCSRAMDPSKPGRTERCSGPTRGTSSRSPARCVRCSGAEA